MVHANTFERYQYFRQAGMGLENSKLLEPVHHFTIIFAYVRIPMSKLKCQMNVKAQTSRHLIAISVFDIS